MRDHSTAWLCTACRNILPKAEAEARTLRASEPSELGEWLCPQCSAIGQFVSDLSPEWADMANDLVFEAYAASLQKAGYEVILYSAECDREDHQQCKGKNRAGYPEFDRCLCECHK